MHKYILQMKKYILLLLLNLFASTALFAQISVKSFEVLETDLEATTFSPKKDINGKNCAIIKVFTTQTGFSFDNGALGIVAVEQKPAEIWVYVPEGTMKLKIVHPQLGHITNAEKDGYYWFPEGRLKSGVVYKMDLITGVVRTIVEEPKIQTGWLLISSAPTGADVYLSQNGQDETLIGITPLSKKLDYGMYSYRLKKFNYNDEVGLLEIKDESHTLNIDLKPIRNTSTEVPVIKTEENPKAVIKDTAEVVKIKKEPIFKIGVEGSFDYANIASHSKIAFGIGVMARLGRINSLIKGTIGLKYQYSQASKEVSYDFLDYESYNTFKGKAKYSNTANEIIIPAIVNFNLKKVYIGVGYEQGIAIGQKESYTPTGNDGFDLDVYNAITEYNGEKVTTVSFPSSSIVAQVGWLHKHYDLKLYYKYNLSNSSNSQMTIGVGFGYYF